MNSEIPRFDQVHKAFRAKKYKIFDACYDLNLFGVRTEVRHAGRFDDWIGVFYTNPGGGINYHVWEATTDPSDEWLMKLGNAQGTAILMTGQWRGCWTKGLHRGKYPALVQSKPVKVWRDKNRDTVLDIGPDTPVFEGLFGINIHKAHASIELNRIGPYSAGCQVTRDPDDFQLLMALVDKQIDEIKANVFTYTLFDMADLNGHA